MHKFIIAGRTGSGKTALLTKLAAKFPEYNALTTHTTRPRRDAEPETAYHFETEESASEKTGRVLETRLNGFLYFSTKQDIETARFMVLDLPGIMEIAKIFPNDEFHLFYVRADRNKAKCFAMNRSSDKKAAGEIFDARYCSESDSFRQLEAMLLSDEQTEEWPENLTVAKNFMNNFRTDTLDKMVEQSEKYIRNVTERT